MSQDRFFRRIAPALTLILAAPMVAEVLPGATRMSSIFVLPVEMGIWGVGALLIRAAVRKWQLGWRNMLLLALALCCAEEFLIQQTSFAPLVIELVKGPPYARDFGVNWLYLLWAVGYESVLVVFLPVMLVELMFPSRRDGVWVNRTGLVVSTLAFAISCFFAWFTWTQIARTKVFHLLAYALPLTHVIAAAVAIVVLIVLALGPVRRAIAKPSRPFATPAPIMAGALAGAIAVVWYALVVLAFRAWPWVPPLPAAIAGLAVALAGMAVFARWSAAWTDRHRYAVVLGGMLGSMGIGFVGFIGATPLDLWGKTVLDIAALLAMAALGWRIRARTR